MAEPDVKTTGAFIRSYNHDTDFSAVVEICKATADPSYAPALELVPYIYAIPYIRLCPESAFILDDGAGTPVGYIIGTPNTRTFVHLYRDIYLPSTSLPEPTTTPPTPLRKELEDQYRKPEGMIRDDIVDEFPAHLHIDILPSHQRHGWGGQLMERFLGALKESGVKGVHLAVGKDNVGAVRFYERCGFVERRVEEGARWMVKGL